jgi:putative flippase GtrA
MPEPPPLTPPAPKRRLLGQFTSVALIGFLVSAAVLHLGLEAGLRPWAARLVALALAMNLTFAVNGLFVFRALSRKTLLPQWAAYLANSAFGNTCNYAVFVALESTHWPVVGQPYVALAAGSITAWAINFTGARLIVFGSAGRRLASAALRRLSPRPRPRVPASTGPGSSRR